VRALSSFSLVQLLTEGAEHLELDPILWLACCPLQADEIIERTCLYDEVVA